MTPSAGMAACVGSDTLAVGNPNALPRPSLTTALDAVQSSPVCFRRGNGVTGVDARTDVSGRERHRFRP